MNRHEEAIETIWLILENNKQEMVSPKLALKHIEETLTLLNSRLEDDSEAQHQAYLADQACKTYRKNYHHV